MLIDTHCHLTYDELRPQIGAVLERAREAGVSRCITVATSPADARLAAGLLAEHAEMWLAAGIHPHEAGRRTYEDQQQLEAIHLSDGLPEKVRGRLVAVGETGLDFHYDFAPRARQEEVFRHQIELARRCGRPIIIHARKSEEVVCDILAGYGDLAGRVVFHCFSGGAALARRILDLGFWLSFTGVATFRNADDVQESAQLVPADRIMLETDAPYLTPEPIRKRRPNEPAYVAHTARFIAELRGQSYEDFARQTTANAERFFGLT
ncbi:MAG: D-aminoacyl-tRNA deacylase [Phycisphaerae bacterium]|nr:D-aminoacyl-tRNA deacylase [Phycisphaerae bacterium]